MGSELILLLIKHLVVPEVTKYLAARQRAGLPPPTEAELTAELVDRCGDAIRQGEAFLSMKGVPHD